MRLLFDQNISHRILRLLPESYHDSSSVKKENLIDSSDKKIWEYAKSFGFTIVTQDSDFNDLTALNGFPPKVIWIRSGNLRTEQIAEILTLYSKEISEFIADDNHGCFEIITLRK